MKLPPISREALDSLDSAAFDALARQSSDVQSFLSQREHYRLLTYLGTKIEPGMTIIDIGTHRGDSALALAHGGRYTLSFDVEDRMVGRIRPANVSYHLVDLWKPDSREHWADALLRSPLIFLDIDPHEGTREYSLLRWLQANSFQGLLLLDDVHHFPQMQHNCWNHIEPQFKRDWTSLGHWTGTGAVCFTGFEE